MKLLWIIRRQVGRLWRAMITGHLEEDDLIIDGPFLDDDLGDEQRSEN